MKDAQPTAEAVAVKDGKILAVGTRTQVMEYQDEATGIIDLNGKIMVPGFIDAHSHILNYAIMTAVANLSPPPDSDVENIADIIEKLRQQIDTPTTEALGWVLGNGYDNSLLAEQRHPTRDDLDQVSTKLPVLVLHASGHLGAINSKALEKLGFTAETPGTEIPDFLEKSGILLGYTVLHKPEIGCNLAGLRHLDMNA